MLLTLGTMSGSGLNYYCELISFEIGEAIRLVFNLNGTLEFFFIVKLVFIPSVPSFKLAGEGIKKNCLEILRSPAWSTSGDKLCYCGDLDLKFELLCDFCLSYDF